MVYLSPKNNPVNKRFRNFANRPQIIPIGVHGDGADLKVFTARLMSQKGVGSVKRTTIQVDE